MNHWIRLPFPLQLHYLQALEQLLPALKKRTQRGGKQRFAETARTAKENIWTQLDHSPHQVSLVHINIVFFSNPAEGLDSYWVTLHFVTHKMAKLEFHIY